MSKNTYRFKKDKHIIIDVLHSIIQLDAHAEGISFNAMLRRISENCDITYSCLRNWFYGATLNPFYGKVETVIVYLKYSVPIGTRKYNPKVVQLFPARRKKAA